MNTHMTGSVLVQTHVRTGWHGLMVMTFASHAKGSEFDPRYQYFIFVSARLAGVFTHICKDPYTASKLAYGQAHGVGCYLRVSIVVSISACHADDPGSIPGRGTFCCLCGIRIPM